MLTLTPDHTLVIEPHLKKLRLVIMENGQELVCRKESLNKLSKFANATEAHLFKGRLQLYKDRGSITVEVKGNTLAHIPADQFKHLLAKVDQAVMV